MSRHVELERVLQAWFEWENCSPAQKKQYRDAFHRRLDEARAGSNVSRQDMIVALAERYREFRASQEKQIRAKISRLR
jgi:hypothetical protein